MSYDLYFCKKSDSKVSSSDIEEYLNKLPNIIYNDSQWFYQNEATGVYFSFDFDSTNENNFSEDISSDIMYTGFSFNINFIRPQFFGLEAFPIVDSLVQGLDLLILNPQRESIPMLYKKGFLQEDWEESNMKFSKTFYKENEVLNFLEEEKSNYTWEYCSKKDDLQHALGDEYFVPNIFYIKSNNSREIKTLCVWTEGIPFVLPKTDYVAISKRYRKFLFVKNETGVVSYKTIIENFGDYFENEKLYKILHPLESSKILKDFNSLELETTIEKLGKGMSVENFVNAKDE